MCRSVALILSLICVTFGLKPPYESKTYRSDYYLDNDNDIFYKQHKELKSYDEARDVCHSEGAELMVSSWPDVMQLEKLFKENPDLPDKAWLGDEEGIKNKLTSRFNIIEAKSAKPRSRKQHKAMLKDKTILAISIDEQLPFICKVIVEDAPFNAHCQVYGRGYHSSAITGSCYKISELAMTWDQALKECETEGSHLLVLNSVAEKDVVVDLIKKFPSKADWMEEYFAGFKTDDTSKESPRIFTTILGEKLGKAGYSWWAEGEPNNTDGSENCGSIYKADGTLNDLNCAFAHPFICEKEVKIATEKK